MGLKSTYLFLGVFLLFGWQAQAQISCTYTLELYDSFGDGWNGSVLTVSIDGNATDYTLFNDANDSFNSFPIVVTEGQEVSLSYSPGTFEGEVTYFLYDSDGNLTFSDGPNPTVGTDIFTFTSVCPSCPSVLSNSVSVDDIRAYYADVSWIPTDPDGVYLLEFGLPGFMNGDGTVIEADGGSGRLQPLEENTMYEFYLSVACSNGDTSQIIGPFAFTTRFANDVGIVMLDSPVTGCGLGISEELSVTLFNFGGLPQSLIPFNYSVNGIPGGVNQPIDGFFTGVLGTDSLFTIPFDMNYDFSEFGDYEIMVWTELDDDSVISNDTFTVTITNIPVISELPYFENYESGNGGWTVGEASVNGTWAYGMPAGAMISEAASGEFAWVTNLEGSYNNSELAYLQSPCFDFSNLPADPRISFSLFFDSESCCDEAWLEVSTDAGASWTKVGTSGTGSNWYNDTFNNWWDGTGGFTGWVTAQNDLTGTAGSSDVIVRFVFSSDGSVVREGVGVDDILIAPILAADLAADSGNDTSEAVCGDPANSVVINVKNDGYEAQNGFSVGYAVNGGDAVTETVPGDFSIEPGEIMPYTFTTTFASTEPGDYTVAVWTDLTGDGLALNDTTYFTFTVAPTIAAYPYYQDFESGNGGWTVDAASTNSSWAFGEPAGAVITSAASGMNAWVTNLVGTYNNSEFSYLLSPCLDFSTLAEDPSLSFSLFFDSESCCDEGWVEVSTDGGESWTKVGTSGTGVNWYNDSGNNWWDGTGNFTGWVTAKNILTGTAGEPNVNLRFVMSTDGSVVREGMGIDNVFITTPLDIDLAASSPSHTADEECGDPEDMLTVTITNAGQSPQSGFNVSYQVNGGDIITEMVSDTVTLDPDESYDYTFLTTLDASAFIDYDIIFWADQPGDGFLINDTTYLSFSIAPAELPYAENFESMAIPADWTVDADLFVNNGHNNTSYVLSDNMFSGDQSFSATMPVLGPVEATDTLYFDYRYTNWSAGTEATVLSENDIFTVLVSTDCGETYTALYVINSANHVPTAEMTTVAVSLADFAGQYIRIQFSAIYGEGDYWLDLDNIFIPRCPPSLELTSEVTDASGPDIADGAVTVTPAAGAGPYQYFWSNGTTDPALTGVLPGDYNVVVVDAFGCTDVIDVTVDFMVSTDNLTETFGEVTLAPNPSAGMANLSVTFNETVDARVSVHNMLGQQAWQAAPQRGVRQLNETIDLQNWPAGIYLVRVQANDQVKVVKLVKQ